MNPDIPSVSTFRVEKPGKSKFAPSISGRKAVKDSSTATASTSSTATTNTLAPSSTEVDHAEDQLPEESVDFSSILNDEIGTEPAAQSKSQGTRIESVATRRQVAKEPSREPSSAPKLPEGPKNAASIATSATGGEAAALKQTMAYFLKDTKLGREMPVSGSASAKGTTDRSSGRRVVNLKNIKASRSTATALAPQVRVVNDKIVYDEEMVAVAAPSATDNMEDELEYVEDDEHGKHLTSATYAKRTGSNRWNADDTEFFYEALAMCGTDFSMIQTFFPHRTRAQVKGKFKIEERTSPARVAQALKQKKPFDSSLKSRINKEEEQ